MPVLFDLDDTLLDDAGGQQVYLTTLYATWRSRLTHSEAAFRVAWKQAVERHFERYTRGEISFQEQRRARLRQVFAQPNLSDDAADELIAEFVAAYEASWRLFPDVVPALDALRGVKLGVVTNGNRDQQMRKLIRMGIIDRFDVVVISEDAGCAKPLPEIFLRACAALGSRANACVFVGDDWICDVHGARQAGLNAIWLTRTAREPVEDHSVPRVESLTALIQRPELRSLLK